MNTQADIAQTLADYQRTQFRGWPFEDHAPMHGLDLARFARHLDGREERPENYFPAQSRLRRSRSALCRLAPA